MQSEVGYDQDTGLEPVKRKLENNKSKVLRCCTGLVLMGQERPTGYKNSVKCECCETDKLEDLVDGYWHCQEHSKDYCKLCITDENLDSLKTVLPEEVDLGSRWTSAGTRPQGHTREYVMRVAPFNAKSWNPTSTNREEILSKMASVCKSCFEVMRYDELKLPLYKDLTFNLHRRLQCVDISGSMFGEKNEDLCKAIKDIATDIIRGTKDLETVFCLIVGVFSDERREHKTNELEVLNEYLKNKVQKEEKCGLMITTGAFCVYFATPEDKKVELREKNLIIAEYIKKENFEECVKLRDEKRFLTGGFDKLCKEWLETKVEMSRTKAVDNSSQTTERVVNDEKHEIDPSRAKKLVQSCLVGTKLNLSNNLLRESADALKELASVSEIENVTILNLGSNDIKQMDIGDLGQLIKKMEKLKTIDLHESGLGDIEITALATAFKELDLLSEYNLEGNNLTSKGVAGFLQDVKNRMIYLNFSRNFGKELSTTDKFGLTSVLATCHCLSKLSLCDVSIQIDLLAECLGKLIKLSELFLDNNGLGEKEIEILGPVFAKICNLRVLSLKENKISSTIAAGILAVELKALPALSNVYLCGNALTDESITVLREALQNVELDLETAGNLKKSSPGANIIRCYKCSCLGHTGSCCPANLNKSIGGVGKKVKVEKCWTCGQYGHKAAGCSNKEKICFACGEKGHRQFDKECRAPKNTWRRCWNCGEDGHMTRNCATKHKSGGRKGLCFVCWKVGHISNNCPEKCTDCTKKGRAPHTKDKCPNKKVVVEELEVEIPEPAAGPKLSAQSKQPRSNNKDPFAMPISARQRSATSFRDMRRRPLFRSIYKKGEGYRHGVFPRIGQRGLAYPTANTPQAAAPWFSGYHESGYQVDNMYQQQWTRQHQPLAPQRIGDNHWMQGNRSNHNRNSRNARWKKYSEENQELNMNGISMQRVEREHWIANQSNDKQNWDKAGTSPCFNGMDGETVQELKKPPRHGDMADINPSMHHSPMETDTPPSQETRIASVSKRDVYNQNSLISASGVDNLGNSFKMQLPQSQDSHQERESGPTVKEMLLES